MKKIHVKGAAIFALAVIAGFVGSQTEKVDAYEQPTPVVYTEVSEVEFLFGQEQIQAELHLKLEEKF